MRMAASLRLLVIVGALLATLQTACTRSDPEKELRATVSAIVQAIEQHRVGDALDSVADDFTRESGSFGKADARRLLAAVMLRNERIHLSAVVTELRIESTRAFVKLRVIATGGAGMLPDRGQTWEFDTVWGREQRHWSVYNAEWREGI